MSDFTVRSDSVDVEQIMRQIRARIREKRGADYTEAEVQQLANVKLETFLDPKRVNSDLVEQFRRHRTAEAGPAGYQFEETALYESHRGSVRAIRKFLNPILKLFLNPKPLVDSLEQFRLREALYFEAIHNLVVEATRLGIEVHNLKMRLESISGRLDFDERRGRSLEGVVQYRRPSPPPSSAGSPGSQGSQRSQGTPSSQGAQTSQRTQAPQSSFGSPGSQGSSRGGYESVGVASPAGPAPSDTPSGTPSVVPGGGPQVAPQGGQQGQPGGEGGDQRRRRRRRRRRRPGAPYAGGQGAPGAPGGAAAGAQGAVAAGSSGAPDSGGGDDGGGDDGGDFDAGGDDGAQGQ